MEAPIPSSQFSRDLSKIYGFGCLALVVVGGIGAYFAGRAMRGCDPVVRSRLVAPDSTNEAIVWGYECGWMLKGMTSVTLANPGDSLQTNRPAFVLMDTVATRLVTNRQQPPAVDLTWQSADTLLIRYDALGSEMTRQDLVRGVVILFEPFH